MRDAVFRVIFPGSLKFANITPNIILFKLPQEWQEEFDKSGFVRRIMYFSKTF